VAITLAVGFVSPVPALVIGVVAGVVSFMAIELKTRFRYGATLAIVKLVDVLMGFRADQEAENGGAIPPLPDRGGVRRPSGSPGVHEDD